MRFGARLTGAGRRAIQLGDDLREFVLVSRQLPHLIPHQVKKGLSCVT
jgi:hypothetical protein